MVGFAFGILRYFKYNSEKGQFDCAFGSDRWVYSNFVITYSQVANRRGLLNGGGVRISLKFNKQGGQK